MQKHGVNFASIEITKKTYTILWRINYKKEFLDFKHKVKSNKLHKLLIQKDPNELDIRETLIKIIKSKTETIDLNKNSSRINIETTVDK